MLPLTEDIALMHKFLATQCSESLSSLEDNTEDANTRSKAWLSLAQVVLAQLILFNRRRVGEVSKMTLSNFRGANTMSNSDMLQHLSPVEHQLCSVLCRIEVVGKRGNHVPILLTSAYHNAVKAVVDYRQVGNVPETNHYVFGRPYSDGHIRGSDILRLFAGKCGARLPEALRGTALRKHVATVSQVLNLKDNELDLLAQFMGHNIRVHREFYRLPSDLLQTAKVAKLLVAMESGQQQRLTGQSLDELNIDINEELATEEAANDDSDDEPGLPEPEPCEQLLHEGSHRPNIVKRHWTSAEKEAVRAGLGSFFFRQVLPGKREIMECIKKYPVLKDRSWKNVKDFIRNGQLKNKDNKVPGASTSAV